MNTQDPWGKKHHQHRGEPVDSGASSSALHLIGPEGKKLVDPSHQVALLAHLLLASRQVSTTGRRLPGSFYVFKGWLPTAYCLTEHCLFRLARSPVA